MVGKFNSFTLALFVMLLYSYGEVDYHKRTEGEKILKN